MEEVLPLDRPVDRQAVSEEDTPIGPEEVPLPGRLVHHRREVVAARPTGQNAADQTLGPARTSLSALAFRLRRVRFPFRIQGLGFALERQADRQGVAQAANNLHRALQVQETTRHIGVGISLMHLALIRFQNRSLRLPPMAGPLRLRLRFGSYLDSAPVDRYHRHLRTGALRVRNGVLGHEGQLLMLRDGRVALVGPLLTDSLDQPLDRFGLDHQVGQHGQMVGGLLVGRCFDAGVDDLLLYARAEARVINAQRLVLREKKPADSGYNSRPVGSTRHLPA